MPSFDDFQRITTERDRLNAILRATAEALHLPADGTFNHIPAAASVAYDATVNLRDQLDRANTERARLAEELSLVRDAAHRRDLASNDERTQWQAEIAHLRSLIANRHDWETIPVEDIRKALRDGPTAALGSPRPAQEDPWGALDEAMRPVVAQALDVREG